MTATVFENFTVHPASHSFTTPINQWDKDVMKFPMRTGKSLRGISAVVDDVCICPMEVATIISGICVCVCIQRECGAKQMFLAPESTIVVV